MKKKLFSFLVILGLLISFFVIAQPNVLAWDFPVLNGGGGGGGVPPTEETPGEFITPGDEAAWLENYLGEQRAEEVPPEEEVPSEEKLMPPFTFDSIIMNGGTVSPEEVPEEEKIPLEEMPEEMTPEEEIEWLKNELRKEGIAPPREVIIPSEGEIAVIKGRAEVRGEVENAQSVEYYLQRPGSMTSPIYIGAAYPIVVHNIWALDWDSASVPNGEYELFPKINNAYGEYFGLSIWILVNNEIERDAEAEENLEKEIVETEEMLRKEEEKITQIKSQTEEEIRKSMEDLAEKTQEILEESEKKIIESEVSEELERSAKGIGEILEELTAKIKEEVKITDEGELERIQMEKEEIEKEVLQELANPIKPIEEVAKEEIKSQISESRKETEEKVESFLEEMESEILEREQARIEIEKKFLIKDSDNDGLPDHEEIRLGTYPFNPDTDGDGFLDGIEIAAGYDPLKPGPADKIIYQNPRKVSLKEAEIYVVERVSIVILPTGEPGLKFEGKGLPNTFVTLYIYSPLLILTTKTDGNGYWECVLDKPLEEGPHEIYVAVTNNGGEITARSGKFAFLMKPGAVAAIGLLGEKAISPTEALQRVSLILFVAIMILTVGVALIIIGILTRKAEKKEFKG